MDITGVVLLGAIVVVSVLAWLEKRYARSKFPFNRRNGGRNKDRSVPEASRDSVLPTG